MSTKDATTLTATITLKRPLDMTAAEYEENLRQVLPSLGTLFSLSVSETEATPEGEPIDEPNRPIQRGKADAGKSVLGAKRARRRVKGSPRLR